MSARKVTPKVPGSIDALGAVKSVTGRAHCNRIFLRNDQFVNKNR